MLPVAPPELEVPGSLLLYDVNRDSRFPYIFQVDSHLLAHDRNLLLPRCILVYIQDRSAEGLEALEAFEASLEVLLGPDDSVSNLGAWMCSNFFCSRLQWFEGIFEIDHDNLVFIRDMQDPDPENDVLGGWVSDW
jgi:hypothetical protein